PFDEINLDIARTENGRGHASSRVSERRNAARSRARSSPTASNLSGSELLGDQLVVEISHAVAAVVFGHIQSLVGYADQVFLTEGVQGEIRRADGRGDVADAGESQRGNAFADTVRHLDCTGQWCFRQDYGELFAAVSRREIEFAAAGADRFRNG